MKDFLIGALSVLSIVQTIAILVAMSVIADYQAKVKELKGEKAK